MSTFLKESYLFNLIQEREKSKPKDFYRTRKHYKNVKSLKKTYLTTVLE